MNSSMPVAAGVPPIHFGVRELRSGNADGGRADFEQMLAQLASATNPNVRMIAVNPGDWGIDAFAGDLGGAITVWQSKYLMPKTTTNHSQQIRESLTNALKAASANGHTIKLWILCIPSSMDGPAAKWWDGWKKRKERDHGLVIELWDETTLVKKLQSPEGDQVRRAYYEVFTPAAPVQEQMRLVLDVEEDKATALDSALFVRQMTEAGHVELDSAKRQFFNADLVAREVAHKGVPSEVAALSSADATLHGIWEMQFNECSSEGSLPALHGRVWREVRSEQDKLPKALRLEVTHSWGLVHRLVDNRRAGWVTHWRQIASGHADG
ncbi:serine/threonine protein kinase [Streptomyces microflavus]|uniref:serine/threonine protein kinase n=1 Tax=Streptomyces microflavus TaxID=1919 RepID=UPI0029A65458|nr:serine/threonine protein kinase [Streptomyces microflavus]MDX2403906.1 serine/threonine protein kinase [Streptomyces microflavus]